MIVLQPEGATHLYNKTNLALKICNVSQSYGEKPILNRINLEIPVGEFVSLVGPSGCGKSTLLRAILGTDAPKEGDIFTDVIPLYPSGQGAIWEPQWQANKVTGPNRNVGIVYQHYSLYDFLTAEQNVAFGLAQDQTSPFYRWFGGPFGWWSLKKQHLEQSRELLQKLKLAHAGELYPSQMSGGMKQRVAIGQSLIMRPKILLLDEPFGALDEGTREELQNMLIVLYEENQAAKKAGTIPPYTILIVTHELNEAIYLSDRIIGLSQYHCEGDKGATIVYDKPATAFDKRSERDYSLFVAQKDEIRKIVFNSGK